VVEVEVVVRVVSRLHCPMIESTMISTSMISTSFVQPEVWIRFAPHFGQASALVLISFPHSLHFVIATTHPQCVCCELSPQGA
jgi:hypothetical protein